MENDYQTLCNLWKYFTFLEAELKRQALENLSYEEVKQILEKNKPELTKSTIRQYIRYSRKALKNPEVFRIIYFYSIEEAGKLLKMSLKTVKGIKSSLRTLGIDVPEIKKHKYSITSRWQKLLPYKEEEDIRKETKEILKNLSKMFNHNIRSKKFECPLDGYITRRTENAVKHIMKKHPEAWREIKEKLNSFECEMIAQTPIEFTNYDFLFEAIHRSEQDPESIFNDMEFVAMFFNNLNENS